MGGALKNRWPEERNGPAGNTSKSDQKGSKGTYSFLTREATSDFVIARRRTGQIKIGKCILAEKPRQENRPFRFGLGRAREIEKIIRHRYGSVLPEGYGDQYLLAMAHALNASGVDVHGALRNWCCRFAPWLTRRYDHVLSKVAAQVAYRTHDLRADAAANLLGVTMAERSTLGLRTIGACDLSLTERRKMMKARKATMDRDRQRTNRKAEGRKDRKRYEAESLARSKPWIAAGVSRATWYRLRSQGSETSVSRVEYIQISDTPVSTATRSVVDGGTSAQASSSHSEKKSSPPSAKVAKRRVAKRSVAEGQGEREASTPADRAKLCEALDFFHQHNARGGRWMAVPGSPTDVVAA